MKGIALYNSDFFTIKENNELLKENITRILLTSQDERVMSQFGSKLTSYILEPANVLMEDVKGEIRKAINTWEPRVAIEAVDIEYTEYNKVEIHLQLINRDTLESFTYERILRL